MGFNPWTIQKAEDRQDRGDGKGPLCAKCCKGTWLNSYPIPRIPITKAGTWKVENCIILCKKCYLEIGENHTEEIPLDGLRCFTVSKVK